MRNADAYSVAEKGETMKGKTAVPILSASCKLSGTLVDNHDSRF
jgi:hypothetical protein